MSSKDQFFWFVSWININGLDPMRRFSREVGDVMSTGSKYLLIDGYTVAYMLTFALWVLIVLGIFAQRQIFRFRKNNMRREQSLAVGTGFSKSKREELNKRIEAVRNFQLIRAPKFTEIGTIAEHANAPYISRMIAVDELKEIDRQLEFINSDLYRLPGESTYAFLCRMRRIALPMLSETLIERIGYLAEHCRFRSEAFGEEQLSEVRALIKDVVRILNHEQERLSALKPHRTTSGHEGFAASLPGFSKNLVAVDMQRIRRRHSSEGAGKRLQARIPKKRTKAQQSDIEMPLLGQQK